MNRALALKRWGLVRRKVSLYAHQVLTEHSVNVQQMLLLFALNENEALTPGLLSEITATDPASVCRSLETLRKQNLILKNVSPTDARKYLITLTPEGHALCKELKVLHDSVAQQLFKKLNSKELGYFLNALDKIEVQVNEASKIK
ncbi:MAG: MarR family transcriptional regulator [Bdellovibrionota bacterium]